ncbi:MAG: WecB/TagA/CpsF family glycosyltransferase, partial [Chitinivibrionales bacterium]|nr:WecB/TagA/CpsF family glycosyltransferase [Chitinivibrionales bacterium]
MTAPSASQTSFGNYRRERFFGLSIDAVTCTDLINEIKSAILTEQKSVISNHNLHSVYLCLYDKNLLDFINRQRLIHADGMSIIFLARLFRKRLDRAHRTTYVDLMNPLLELLNQLQSRIYFLGGKPHILSRIEAFLRCSYPGIVFHGHDGYFNGDKNDTIIQEIRYHKSQLLFVGMGMPRQEFWIRDNLHNLPEMVIMPCGAAFDYLTGEIPTPPRWSGSIGLEWLYRLKSEPKRLWKRYLIEPVHILFHLIKYKPLWFS